MSEIYAECKDCPSTPENTAMTFINCMSFEKPEEVFERIIEDFKGKKGPVDTQLENIFIKRNNMSYLPFVIPFLILGWWYWMKWTTW
jgi:hypothetical protein